MDQHSVRHYCGLFGVFGHEEAVYLTQLGLYALQHRGQEAAGIVSTDGQSLAREAGVGLVNEVFDQDRLAKIKAPVAIGHTRYSTTGSSTTVNVQPLMFSYAGGKQVAIAHNGNLVNAALLRRAYEEHGSIFQTTCDTEVIIHLLAKPSHQEKKNTLGHILNHLQGAYALLFLFPDRMVAVRDPLGFRPLCLGEIEGGATVVASETKALDMVNARFIREVEPGEIVTISKKGVESRRFGGELSKGASCIFEQIYFADPSSIIFGETVHLVRKKMGAQIAREAPVDADLVVPIPTCATCAATGYAQATGIPYGRAFTTSHYVGRSFIVPTQSGRDLAVKMKLNVIREAVAGKRLVVVEDSVVRGTTTRLKIGALRDAGAKEIHLRVASPPIRHPCYFGIDFPQQEKLIAHERKVDDIRDYLGVDSLAYLSLEGMLSCVKMDPDRYCTACFSGDYPINIDEPVEKYALENGQLRIFG